MSQSNTRPPEPARGARAGIKADLQRAKEAGKAYDPRGTGNAYTHNFLNQKPWHPLNFRNQIKKFEAEQQQIREQKAKEQGQAEFDAEQETMKTMSYLSEQQQQQYKDRASIAFMYAKPPGLEAALAKEQATAAAKEKAKAEAEAAVAASTALVAPGTSSAAAAAAAQQAQLEAAQRARDLDRVREDPFAVMLQARVALQNSEKFDIRGSGVGGNVYGGYSSQAANQLLLGDDGYQAGPGPGSSYRGGGADLLSQGPGQMELLPGVLADAADLAVLAGMSEDERAAVMRKLKKLQQQQEEQRQLAEAQAVLQAAGYDMSLLGKESGGTRKSKHKKDDAKRKRKKKSHRSKGSKAKGKRHKSSSKNENSRASQSGSDSDDRSSSDASSDKSS